MLLVAISYLRRLNELFCGIQHHVGARGIEYHLRACGIRI